VKLLEVLCLGVGNRGAGGDGDPFIMPDAARQYLVLASRGVELPPT